MKTTLDLDDALMRNAKAFAARQGRSLTRLIEDSLRIHLRAQKAGGAAAVTGDSCLPRQRWSAAGDRSSQ